MSTSTGVWSIGEINLIQSSVNVRSHASDGEARSGRAIRMGRSGAPAGTSTIAGRAPRAAARFRRLRRLARLLRRFGVTLPLLAALLALAMTGAAAQSAGDLASLEGVMKDNTGGIIPGVTVVLTRKSDGSIRQAVTDDGGYYYFSNLPPGEYDLRAELEGFNPVVMRGIRLQPGERRLVGGRRTAANPPPLPAGGPTVQEPPPPLTVFDPRSVAPEGGDDGRTLSPYFVVNSADPDTDRLPLKATAVEVKIVGVIADVTVTQTYANEGFNPLEAIYVFPCSTRAAVYGMRMTVGKRVIEARIREKQKARAEYEQAKQEGRRASLLVQERPNVFTMNVANILPGDIIQVELRYTELLYPVDGFYEFVYPTVVMPRYSRAGGSGGPGSQPLPESPYAPNKALPTGTFDLTATVTAGLPITAIGCISHPVEVDQPDATRAIVRLDGSEAFGGDRDYILRYCLSDFQIQTGVLAYEDEEEGFFLLMVQPPRRTEKVTQVPQEYIFIVDVSGSMSGTPLETAKKLLQELVGNLRPADRFNVLLFAGGSSVMAEASVPATRENIDQAIRLINNQGGGGGTELLPALRRALKMPRPKGFVRTVAIVTDGGIDVEKEAFDLARDKLGDGRLFSFGVGGSVNRFAIEGLAKAGRGELCVIADPADVPNEAARFRQCVLTPLLTGIEVNFHGVNVHDLEPKSSEDLLADRPLILFGKWEPPFRGLVTISGQTTEGTWVRDVDLAGCRPDPGCEALRHLWARRRIAELGDFTVLPPGDPRIQEITDLGLRYSLMTDYTSFIAVDTERANPAGPPRPLKQALPVPQGVSAAAVGIDGGLVLTVSELCCMVEVNAETEMVCTCTSTLEYTTSQHDIESLPIQGRNPLGLVYLAGGVAVSSVGPSISGAQPGESNYQLDGVDNSPVSWTGSGASTSSECPAAAGLGQDLGVVAETRVLTAGLEAGYGGTSGGVVDVISKSGTNEHHGTVSFFARPAGFEADRLDLNPGRLEPLAETRSREELSFTAGFGGFIVRDRLFYYLNASLGRSAASVMAPPGFGQALSGLNPYGLVRRDLSGMAKLSWMVNVAHDLQLSIYGDSARNGEGPNRTMLAPGEAAWTRPTAVAWMGTARYTWILDPSLVLCAALSIGRDRRGEGLSEPGTAALFDHAGFYRDVVRPADPTAAPGNYGRLWQGGAGYAADSRGGHLEMDLRFNWTLNTHGLTFGYNFRRDNLQWNRGFSGADIAIPALGDFAGGISHGAFVHLGWRVDPDTGAAMDLNGDGRVDEADALYIQTGGMLSSPEARGRSDTHGLFVQDTWRVTPNWTLSLGIRNDLQCLSGDRGSVRFLSNWAPRLGVIWDPFGDGKTGIRAAWGRYYGRVPAELGIRAFSGEGFVSDVLWADPALTDCRNAELGEPVRVFGGHPAMVADGTGAECQDEILAGVQREITPGLAVSATFIRRDLRRALARIGGLSVEDYLADESPAAYAFLLANPSPSLDAVHNDSGAPGPDGRPDGWPDVQRSFTALELSLDRRFSGGVQFRASYRLGWLTGNYDGPAGDAGFADGPAAGGRFNFLPGPALGYLFNDGPLALDQRHVVTASGVWELPHHFRVGWGFQAASGAPVTPLGTHPVYQVDGVIPLASRGAAGRLEWECTAALHAEYRLPLGDGNCRLALGADLFNVLNRQSAASADTRSQSFFSPNPDYGLPTRYTEPFSLRLLARFEF